MFFFICFNEINHVLVLVDVFAKCCSSGVGVTVLHDMHSVCKKRCEVLQINIYKPKVAAWPLNQS